jgi:XTP/dITP diphosphohydrolase
VAEPPAHPGVAEAIEVVDRLRSPGGCPWDAAQTHHSLAPYLLEETYEVLDAIESGTPAELREELGDLLFQVLFHARLGEEGEQPWTVDDVARDLAEKLRRRHPHVFADVRVSGADEINANWHRIKAAEKERASVLDGVPGGQPALALAAKVVARAERAGLAAAGPAGAGIGAELLALVRRAVAEGVDPEQALRETTRGYAAAVRAAEAGRPQG